MQRSDKRWQVLCLVGALGHTTEKSVADILGYKGQNGANNYFRPLIEDGLIKPYGSDRTLTSDGAKALAVYYIDQI